MVTAAVESPRHIETIVCVNMCTADDAVISKTELSQREIAQFANYFIFSKNNFFAIK